MSSYAHPDMLVSTEWLAGHLTDPAICVIEIGAFEPTYDGGHIPGALHWPWKKSLSHRASLIWFTARFLLGYPRVRSYDGSWTEWGSMVGMPIEIE